MKRLLLFLGVILLTSSMSFSQIIVSGISPASIAGNYAFEYGATNQAWGNSHIDDPAYAIQDELVLFVEADGGNLGCTAAANGGDIAGHIAILFRGNCEFGKKALEAQNAGAIGCIIINNVPGAPVGMNGGASGATVTIPVVMISDIDGASLLAEMQNGPVVMFIGNKLGLFPNDLTINPNAIYRPQFSSIPSAIAEDGSDYTIKFGGTVYNFGSNDQSDISLNAVITFNGTEVYNETVTSSDLLEAGDSVDIFLPDFAPTSWAEGYYHLEYTASTPNTDDDPQDNTITSDFVISPSDFSYASIDETTFAPKSSGGSRPIDGNGNPIPHYSQCVNFMSPKASKLAPVSLTFTAMKGSAATNTSMEGEPLMISMTSYNDQFTTIEDAGFANPISLYNELLNVSFDVLEDTSSVTMTANFNPNEIFALDDNQRYLFCVTTFNTEVYFGTDPDKDYNGNFGLYLQPMFPVEAGQGSFNPYGFGAETVPGISVTFIPAEQVSLAKEEMNITMKAYPSPASEELNINFNNYDVNSVELINTVGQTVLTQSVKNNANSTALNVSGLDNGMYIVRVSLTNGMKHTMSVVVNH